jgi:hypothetical protein
MPYQYTLEISVSSTKPTLLKTEVFPNPICTGDMVTVDIWPDKSENLHVENVIHHPKAGSTLILGGAEGLDWKQIAESGFSFNLP